MLTRWEWLTIICLSAAMLFCAWKALFEIGRTVQWMP